MPRVMVLGTGTEIGKTHVTLALARGLAARGRRVAAVKPIESGYTLEAHAQSDAGRLETVSAVTVNPHPLFALAEPISPHLAARRTGRSIDTSEVTLWLNGVPPVDWLLVETAGGAFSPLGPRTVNADLVAACHADCVLLVAPDRLGVLHDVTAALVALRSKGVHVDGVVLSGVGAGDASVGTNADELRTLEVHPEVAEVAHGERQADAVAALLLDQRKGE